MDEERETARRSLGVMKKSGKLTVALCGLAAGLFLLLWGNRAENRTEKEPPPSAPPGESFCLTMEQYRAGLEERMAAICGEMKGVGAVRVIVSLENGFEYVYAYDTRQTAGGENTSYIVIGSGNHESLVYLTERVPKITGIGVVCTGGNNPVVQREVTELLAAAFGVSRHNIYVTACK